MANSKEIKEIMEESANVHLLSIAETEKLAHAIELIISSFKHGKKLILFGNGGSASDAQHIAAEFVGRYKNDRRGLPAIALNTDTSALTAISNDYGYEHVFSRQCEALVCEGDVVIAFSTSGNSKNVINGMKTANEKGAKVIAMTGRNGGQMKHFADVTINVQSDITARIQETHQTMGHILCELVEKGLHY